MTCGGETPINLIASAMNRQPTIPHGCMSAFAWGLVNMMMVWRVGVVADWKGARDGSAWNHVGVGRRAAAPRVDATLGAGLRADVRPRAAGGIDHLHATRGSGGGVGTGIGQMAGGGARCRGRGGAAVGTPRGVRGVLPQVREGGGVGYPAAGSVGGSGVGQPGRDGSAGT